MTAKLGSVFLTCLLIPCCLLGQNGPDNDPDAAQGYVNSVFHHSSVESINLYNGQLTIPIAVGPAYPIGPKLKFQAMLTYTSRAWEFGHPSDQMLHPPEGELPPSVAFEPLFGDPALGIGWNFSLGAIKPCGLSQGSRCYVSPDGAEHLFDQPLDGSHFKSRDGGQLYLHYINNVNESQGYEMWDGDGNRYVFDRHVEGFDDPPAGYFHDFGRGRNGWYLTSLADPFGNGYSVTYYLRADASPCPSSRSGCPNTYPNPDTSMRCSGTSDYSWVPQTIQLPSGYTISIGLDTQPATLKMIKTLTFPVFANGQSASAVWTLNYQTDTYAGSYCSVPLIELASLELPNVPPVAPKYLFQYAALSDGLFPGRTVLLTNMTVPTGASIRYDYGDYSFYHGRVAGLAGPTCQPNGPPTDATVIKSSPPSGGNRPNPSSPNAGDPCVPVGASDYIDSRAGVLRKTETIPGAQPAVTNYTQYAFPFGEQGTWTPGGDKSQTLTVVVTPADMDGRISAKSVLFWSGPKSGSFYYCGNGFGPLAPCPGDRTGAEIREAVYDHEPATSDIGIPMPVCGGGNDTAFCPNHAARVVQRTYDYDFPGAQFGNRRVQIEIAYQGATAADGSCGSPCPLNHTVTFLPTEALAPGHWEANGRHFDTETHSGNLGNDTRTITTTWTPTNWMTPGGQPVLPNLYNHRLESDPSSSIDRYFEFNGTNGFLNCSFLHDAARQRVFFNRRYPNTDGTLYQDFTASATGFPNPPYIGQCTASYPNSPYPSGVAVGDHGDSFGKIYTYQNGLLNTIQWINGITPAGWYAKHYTRDTGTGWITASSDSANKTTSYQYDSLGRVTLIAPPDGEASTVVSYPLTTRTTATRNGGAGLSTYQQYEYDGLGRLSRDIHQMPGINKYAVRTHAYDGPGHQYFDSEWRDCSSGTGDCLTVAPGGTTGSNFDPFGRAQTIVRADGSTTNVSFADTYSIYSDTKKTVTVNNLGGTCSGGSCTLGSASQTIYFSDAFGRLTSVQEPDNAVTRYTYDVNAKLTSVTQTGLPNRTFTFDPAGFLRQESTPEKGTVNYTDYGSLGNVMKETEPDGIVRENCYDFAGRVTETRTSEGGTPLCSYEGGPQGRLYVSNTYNNTTPDNSFGKLTSRTAWDYPSVGTYSVSDTYGYNGMGGRLSTQTTTVSGGSGLTTAQTWLYNGLGLPAHHYHARSSGQTPFVVSYGYDAGLPVKEYANGIPVVTGVGYQASGALAGYVTGLNLGHNVTTTIGQDASLLPRPSSIATSGATVNFVSGSYSYDGAGNIMAIGPDGFGYDLRSRLTSAALSGSGSQAFTYDQRGNLLTKTGTPGNTTFCTGTCTNNRLPGNIATYDGRGNMTANLIAPGGSENYTLDGLDRLITHQGPALTWDYLYDGSSERIAKLLRSGGSTYTFRDEGKRVSAEFGASSPSRDNVFLANLLTVSYASAPGSDRIWTFYASDHLGTPRLITDSTAAMIETPKNWPFGENVNMPGPFQRIRFASMERDTEASRYHDHARGHEFNLARFLSPDPMLDRKLAIGNPQAWNRYSYVLSNPLRWTDPTGREIHYDEEFSRRVRTDTQFRRAFEAWKKTKSGAEQWAKMGADTNTVYTFRVGPVKVMTGIMKEEQANAMTVPVVGPQNENKSGKLDVPQVIMTINADYIKKTNPAEASQNIASAIFEEASHGLDIGSGTKSTKEVYESEARFHSATEPRMERFERELKQAFSPDQD